MEIHKGKRIRPRRTLIYGTDGTGKSTYAASAAGTLFINYEDGLDDIDCDSTPLITSVSHLFEVLTWLRDNDHPYQNIAIDTVDWLEHHIHVDIAKAAEKESIVDIGYGAGYKQAMVIWDKILWSLDWLRLHKGLGIILLAHSATQRFESPEMESYDRYQPALHPLAAARIKEWCDEVLFASYRVFTRTEDQGFNKTRVIAQGDGERYLRTTESAAVVAKNRLGLPPELPMPRVNGWAEYAKYFPQANTGDINGCVADGSSRNTEALTA